MLTLHYKTTEIFNLFMIDKLVVFYDRKMVQHSRTSSYLIDHYQLFFIKSGAMTFLIGDQAVCIEEHQGILIPPGSSFQVPERTENAFANVLGFMCRGDLLPPLCHRPLLFTEDEITLLQELAEEGKQCFERIVTGEEYGCQLRPGITRGRLQSLKNNLEIFFIKLIEARLEAPPSTGRGTVADAVYDYLFAHVADRVSLAQIAGHLSLSVTYIKREFSKKYGKGIIDCLLDMKIERAKSLIEETSLNFTQIANYLSFESESHFSKTFSKRAGLSPLAYLKQVQKRGC